MKKYYVFPTENLKDMWVLETEEFTWPNIPSFGIKTGYLIYSTYHRMWLRFKGNPEEVPSNCLILKPGIKEYSEILPKFKTAILLFGET